MVPTVPTGHAFILKMFIGTLYQSRSILNLLDNVVKFDVIIIVL